MHHHDPGGGGQLSAIDPQMLASMIGGIERGAQALRQRTSALRAEFDRYGVDASAFTEISAIAGWAEEQLPGLRRRQGLAQAMDGSRDPGFVFVAEPVAPLDDVRRDARALADRLNRLDRTDQASAEEVHRIALVLEQYKNDPDFTSTFYAAIEPPVRMAVLPQFIYESGSTTAQADWKVFSEAFGTAVSAQYPDPRFEAVKKSFTEPAPNTPAAWNRGAYLAYGNFPADWLAQVARGGVLDRFADDPQQEWRGGGLAAAWLGLPDDTVALYLEGLSRNGDAARDALTYMGYPDHGHTRPENIESLLRYSRRNEPAADALGKALAAASGVNDEAMGDHTPWAGAFAFDVITTVGHDEGGVEWVMKDSLGEIAASYAPEMLTGSRIDDGVGHASQIQPRRNFDSIPGVDPRFYLSGPDTYRFMKTFAEEAWMSQPFDKAMGELQQQVLREAARQDAAAIDRGEQDPENFERAAAALGGTGGLAYEAQREVRHNMDEFDKRMRGIMKDIATVGIDRVPGGEYLGEFAWETLKFAAGKDLDVWAQGDDTRVDRLQSEDRALLKATRYNMAMSLIDAGWKLKSPPRAPFAKDGKILPFGELAKDKAKLQAFIDWLDENDGYEASFDDKGDDASGRFSGGVKGAQGTASAVDGA